MHATFSKRHQLKASRLVSGNRANRDIHKIHPSVLTVIFSLNGVFLHVPLTKEAHRRSYFLSRAPVKFLSYAPLFPGAPSAVRQKANQRPPASGAGNPGMN